MSTIIQLFTGMGLLMVASCGAGSFKGAKLLSQDMCNGDLCGNTSGIFSLRIDSQQVELFSSNRQDQINAKNGTTGLNYFSQHKDTYVLVNGNFYDFREGLPVVRGLARSGSEILENAPDNRYVWSLIYCFRENSGQKNCKFVSKIKGNPANYSVPTSTYFAATGYGVAIENGLLNSSIDHQHQGSRPRTIIGLDKDYGRIYLGVLKNGKMSTLAKKLSAYGVDDAMGLDGGGSSFLYSRLKVGREISKFHETSRAVPHYVGFRLIR